MILNRQREVRVARRPLESFLRRVKRELHLGRRDVTICLVSDTEMSRLNQRFRKKKGPTDVLSFPQEKQWRVASGEWRARTKTVHSRGNDLREPRAKSRENLQKYELLRKSGTRYLGDVAIAPATARRYAKKHARKVATELRVLILHGVLHLLGYDHETDRGEMDRFEQKLRKRLGIA
jgi:probable rRNA maturation factor